MLWKDWMTPALGLALVAYLWVVLRPAFARLILYLLKFEDERVSRMIFDALTSTDGRIRFRAYGNEIWKDRIEEVDTQLEKALSIAQENKDILNGVTQSVQMQGADLREVKNAVKDLPELSTSMNRMSLSLDRFAAELKHVSETMIRFEVRQEQVDRRLRQEEDSPKRRHGDSEHT